MDIQPTWAHGAKILVAGIGPEAVELPGASPLMPAHVVINDDGPLAAFRRGTLCEQVRVGCVIRVLVLCCCMLWHIGLHVCAEARRPLQDLVSRFPTGAPHWSD